MAPVIASLASLFEQFDLKGTLEAFGILFLAIDMPGNIPILMRIYRKKAYVPANQITAAVTIIIGAFLCIIHYTSSRSHIDLKYFELAGHIFLIFLGIQLVMNWEFFSPSGSSQFIAIMPTAFPILAGPATFAALLAVQQSARWMSMIIAISTNLLIMHTILGKLSWISAKIRPGLFKTLSRAFGIVLISLAARHIWLSFSS